MPRVSVITCVYNFEDIVLETVESILNQTYTDWEFIITDDGSTDRTVERIESIKDPRVKLIRAAHSGLPSVASNIAVAQSTGEFIVITGADDVSLPTRIERQVEFFDQHPDIGVQHSAYHHLINGQVVPLASKMSLPLFMLADAVLERMLEGNFICTPSVTVRRSMMNLADGLYDVRPEVCGPEDFDLWLRLAEADHTFGYIDEPLVQYRLRPDSVSRNRRRSLSGSIVTLESALKRRPDVYRHHAAKVRRRLAYLYREVGGMKLRAGESGALGDVARAIRLAPLQMKSWVWLNLCLCGTGFTNRLLDWYYGHGATTG